MLLKLIKHEYMATWRIFVIFFATIIGLAVMLRISQLAYALYTIVATLYIGVLFASMFVVFIFTVRRFYQSLLSNQAYLTLMLPANAHHQLAAKLIVTATWFVGLFAVIVASVFIGMAGTVVGDAFIEGFGYIGEGIRMLFEAAGINVGLMIVHLVVIIIAFALYMLLLLFFCTTIGGQSGTHKVLKGVLIYYGISMVSQIVLAIVITSFMPNDVLNEVVNVGARLNGAFFTLELLMLGAATGFYFLTARRLTHNFNLQ